MNGSGVGSFIAGIGIGLIAAWVLLAMPDSKISRYDIAIDECQQSLPRDQVCKITAVPVEKGDM